MAQEETDRLHQDLQRQWEPMDELCGGRNDLIRLRFGGEHVVKVKRSLLFQFKGSMLTSMFSRCFKEQFDQDQQRSALFDCRQPHDAPHRVPAPPQGYGRRGRGAPAANESEKQGAWRAMLMFVGLTNALYSTTILRGNHANVRSPTSTARLSVSASPAVFVQRSRTSPFPRRARQRTGGLGLGRVKEGDR